ncbi:MFS transporter [Candidatus Nomurabacteria bacterium]|nr:MFS transporter [Candidatus Nomurabacteria bacterium]
MELLRERNMRWYLGGQLVSLTGTMLQSAVLSLLIIELTKSRPADAVFWVGLVWALNFLPGAATVLVTGIYIDRWDKSRVLKITSILGMLQSFALALLVATNMITVWWICVLALLMGAISAFDGPARNAIIKEAVLDGRNVISAGAAFNSLYNLANIVGPGLAGPLVLTIGYGWSFTINGLSFAAVILALMKMSFEHLGEKASVANSQVKVWDLAKEGFRHVFEKPNLQLCIVLSASICIFGFSYNTILAVVAKEMFVGDYHKIYSWFGVASGLGGFLGSFVAVFWLKRFSVKSSVVGGCLLTGSCLVGFAHTSSLWLGIPLVFWSGFGFMLSFSPLRGAVMHLASPRFIGRVLGIALFFFFSAMMLGPFLIGLSAKYWGCPVVLLTSGVSLLVIAVATPFLPGINEIDK